MLIFWCLDFLIVWLPWLFLMWSLSTNSNSKKCETYIQRGKSWALTDKTLCKHKPVFMNLRIFKLSFRDVFVNDFWGGGGLWRSWEKNVYSFMQLRDHVTYGYKLDRLLFYLVATKTPLQMLYSHLNPIIFVIAMLDEKLTKRVSNT